MTFDLNGNKEPRVCDCYIPELILVILAVGEDELWLALSMLDSSSIFGCGVGNISTI